MPLYTANLIYLGAIVETQEFESPDDKSANQEASASNVLNGAWVEVIRQPKPPRPPLIINKIEPASDIPSEQGTGG